MGDSLLLAEAASARVHQAPGLHLARMKAIGEERRRPKARHAGGIIKEGFSVREITTASSLWVTTSIGVLVGLGFFFPAAVTTVLTLAALVVMRWWEERNPL